MDAAPIASGTKLDCYRVEKRLCSEPFEDSYATVDEHRNRPVLVRVVNLHDEFRARDIARWRQELRRPAEMLLPAILAACDGGATPDGRPWYAMDTGGALDLHARLARGALLPEETLVIARDLATSLAALHVSGYVHGDLRPANVLQGPDGGTRLLAPGVRRAFLRAFAPRLLYPGDPRYQSPEVAAGAPADTPADSWSLGIVLLQLLTGLPAEGLAAMTAGVAEDPAEAAAFLRMQAPALPGWAFELLPACLIAEPHGRLPDGARILEELNRLTGPSTPGDRTGDAGQPGPAPRLPQGQMAPVPFAHLAPSFPPAPVVPADWQPEDPQNPALWKGSTGRTDYSAFYPSAFAVTLSALPALMISLAFAKTGLGVWALFCALELVILALTRIYFELFNVGMDRLYGWLGWREDTWVQVDNRTEGVLELSITRPGSDTPERSSVRPGVREILTLPPGTKLEVRPEPPPEAPEDALLPVLATCTLEGPKELEVRPDGTWVRDGVRVA
ncbi:MAG: protein kinase [Candidatus Wallbacteria bacterium]|nr:protein kinase [Candidatus Wallbacteria bacterium]